MNVIKMSQVPSSDQEGLRDCIAEEILMEEPAIRAEPEERPSTLLPERLSKDVERGFAAASVYPPLLHAVWL